MKQQHLILPFSLLFILIIVALCLRTIELEDATVRIEGLSKDGTGYTSRKIELTDFEQDMLGEAMGYKSIYIWRGLPYVITILDGTRNRQAVHDPRYCFIGAGWSIDEDQKIDFAGGDARRITLSNGEQESEALFFYSTGTSIFSHPIEYWLRATLRRWLRSYGGDEPLLVMVQPLEPGVKLEPALNGLLPVLRLP
ncbi:MAG: hypothetical protein ACI81V_000020 [Lentimonas sp.]|jgi:hypothetical protein